MITGVAITTVATIDVAATATIVEEQAREVTRYSGVATDNKSLFRR